MHVQPARRAARHLLATTLASVLAGVGILTVGLAPDTALPTTTLPAAEAAGAMRSYVVNARSAAQTKAAQAAAVKAGGRVVQSWPQIGVVVVRSNRPGYLATLNRLHSPAVLSAGDARNEPVRDSVALNQSVTVKAPGRRSAAAATKAGRTDPMLARQAHLRTIRATAAQQVTRGSGAVVVGVLDTGVDDTHPDLAANFSRADSVDCTAGGRPNTAAGAWRGRDAHGTHVAGTIAAARNGYGVTGVAPGVRVASVKVVDAAGDSFPEYLVCGYMWAAERQLAVTNASINVFDLWCGNLELRSPALTAVSRAISHANSRRVLNVSSSGNAGMDVSWQRQEACHDPIAEHGAVVHVTSVDARGRLSGFASFGRGMVDVAAPGEKVLSDATGRRFETRSGTSQAAPQVAGTLALMRSRRPTASNATLVARLKSSARKVPVRSIGPDCRGTASNNTCTGAGRLDTLAAVRAMG